MQAAVVVLKSMLESAVKALPEPAMSEEEALQDETIRAVVSEMSKMSESERAFVLKTVRTLMVGKN